MELAATAQDTSKKVTLLVCAQCGGKTDPATGKFVASTEPRSVRAHLRKALPSNTNVEVRLSRCFGVCKERPVYALAGAGRETLILDIAADEPTDVLAQVLSRYQAKRPGTRLKSSEFPHEEGVEVLVRIPPLR